MLENPKYWLSKQTDNSRARDPLVDKPGAGGGKGLEPDFWLVTGRDSVATFQDVESTAGLVMQMQPRPPMPGMPTPTRPPRTASTLQSRTALSAIITTAGAAADDHVSVASAESAVPAPLRLVRSPRASTSSSSRPDLNKPLPRIGTVVLDARFASEASSSQAQKHMSSVYQFIPHEDGHISVHKARKSAFGNG